VIRVWLKDPVASVCYHNAVAVTYPKDQVVVFNKDGEVAGCHPKSRVKLIIPDGQPFIEIMAWLDPAPPEPDDAPDDDEEIIGDRG
jgi:hypothetical protein